MDISHRLFVLSSYMLLCFHYLVLLTSLFMFCTLIFFYLCTCNEWESCICHTRNNINIGGILLSFTPSIPKNKSFQDSKIVPKNKSSYPIQKVHVHARINQCQIWIVNRGKHGHFTFLFICHGIPRMTCFLGWREYYSRKYTCCVLAWHIFIGMHSIK